MSKIKELDYINYMIGKIDMGSMYTEDDKEKNEINDEIDKTIMHLKEVKRIVNI